MRLLTVQSGIIANPTAIAVVAGHAIERAARLLRIFRLDVSAENAADSGRARKTLNVNKHRSGALTQLR
jgi:hypothetical protein